MQEQHKESLIGRVVSCRDLGRLLQDFRATIPHNWSGYQIRHTGYNRLQSPNRKRELFFALLTCRLQFYTGIILQHFKEPTQHETFQYRTELGLKRRHSHGYATIDDMHMHFVTGPLILRFKTQIYNPATYNNTSTFC